MTCQEWQSGRKPRLATVLIILTLRHVKDTPGWAIRRKRSWFRDKPSDSPSGWWSSCLQTYIRYDFFRFTSVYVACECRCISGRPFSPPGSKKSDDRKYVCIDRLLCKNLGTFSLPRTFCCLFWFCCFDFFVLRYSWVLQVLTPRVSFFRSFGLFHLQVQKGMVTIISRKLPQMFSITEGA